MFVQNLTYINIADDRGEHNSLTEGSRSGRGVARVGLFRPRSKEDTMANAREEIEKPRRQAGNYA